MVNSAFAQGAAWPSRPINLIVPAPPGGGVDSTARPLSEMLGLILGTTSTPAELGERVRRTMNNWQSMVKNAGWVPQ